MKQFILLANEAKDPDHSFTKEVADLIRDMGASAEVGFLPCFAEVMSVLEEMDLEKAECALILGGDGTLIRCGRALVHKGIPVLGINVGTLGYLCEVDRNSVKEAISSLISDEFILEPRMMIRGQSSTGIKGEAVNDIVINRAGDLRMLYMDLYVDGELLNTFAGDGLIISTPTGSTGYSMSCGGPIIAPSANMIVVTPIASHSLISRSVVLPAEARIMVKINEGKVGEEVEAQVSYDGTLTGKITTGESLLIETGSDKFKLLRLKKTGFLEILRDKLMKGI